MSSTPHISLMRQVLLFLFLRGDTEAQRVEVNCPGYSVEQKSHILNLSLLNPNLGFFPPSCVASRRCKRKEREDVPKNGLCSGRPWSSGEWVTGRGYCRV